MTHSSQKPNQGFAVVGVVILVIVALVALAGYLLWMEKGTSPHSPKVTDTSPAEYRSNDDLDYGGAALDDIQIDAELDSDLEQLDAEASQF